MSYEDGWAAINLEMPDRVPRTEYSAAGHWDLIKAVTGIDVGVDSPADVQGEAARAFMAAWHFDFQWSTLISRTEFGEHTRRSYGHPSDASLDRRISSSTFEKVRWTTYITTAVVQPNMMMPFAASNEASRRHRSAKTMSP